MSIPLTSCLGDLEENVVWFTIFIDGQHVKIIPLFPSLINLRIWKIQHDLGQTQRGGISIRAIHALIETDLCLLVIFASSSSENMWRENHPDKARVFVRRRTGKLNRLQVPQVKRRAIVKEGLPVFLNSTAIHFSFQIQF